MIFRIFSIRENHQHNKSHNKKYSKQKLTLTEQFYFLPKLEKKY
jgi:hypothetical protein